MYDICHPTYYNMSQLGCNDQVKLTTAFYVFMELCEVKRYWDVEYKYNEKLELFYIQAKKSKSGAVEIFLPWPAIHNFSLDLISNIQEELETEKFTFVFKEGDTTSVYYCISSGMIKPIPPEETKILKRSVYKKVKLEQEIQRNAANLYERALFLNNGENGDNHIKQNINSVDDNITDKQVTEELELEDIETLQTCASQSEDKSDRIDKKDLETKNSELHELEEIEMCETKDENLETEISESEDQNVETETSERKDENVESEMFESECKTNFENTSENLETENVESKNENLPT